MKWTGERYGLSQAQQKSRAVGELREMLVKVVLVGDTQEAQDRDLRKPSACMVGLAVVER